MEDKHDCGGLEPEEMEFDTGRIMIGRAPNPALVSKGHARMHICKSPDDDTFGVTFGGYAHLPEELASLPDDIKCQMEAATVTAFGARFTLAQLKGLRQMIDNHIRREEKKLQANPF